MKTMPTTGPVGEPVDGLTGFSTSRRSLLSAAVGLAVVAMAPGCEAGSVAAAASEQSPDVPNRARGSTRLNVRDSGAHGDCEHDDTAAFQRAIDALPPAGGTVEVPAGTYLIDAERSVRLRDRTHLQLAPDATLVAKPNDAERAYVLYVYQVADAEISGGRIAGERKRHRGTKGEWGHGIQVRGASRVTVRDMHISDCWGDGICIGAAKRGKGPSVLSEDVVIADVVCTGNRRQGLSVGNSRKVRVYDSEFAYTSGTSPQCGIDIEPDRPGSTRDVVIRNCHVHHNASYGILAFLRTYDITIADCLIENNRSCGIVTRGATGVDIIGNTIRGNGSTGLFIKEGTQDCLVRQNTFRHNYTRQERPPRGEFSLAGAPTKIKRDVLVVRKKTSQVHVATNHYL